jgi:hypothetical protein
MKIVLFKTAHRYGRKIFRPYCLCLLLLLAAGCKKDKPTNTDENVVAPPYAATTETWVFGGQTWSDAIHIPECGSPSFDDSYTEPQCRSYAGRYYYNWPYVNQNASALCPSPWRVPAREDFETLTNNTDGNALSALWGYGGYANSNSMEYVNAYGFYWSSTELGSGSYYAYYLRYYSGNPYVANYDKYRGYQVRCVK